MFARRKRLDNALCSPSAMQSKWAAHTRTSTPSAVSANSFPLSGSRCQSAIRAQKRTGWTAADAGGEDNNAAASAGVRAGLMFDSVLVGCLPATRVDAISGTSMRGSVAATILPSFKSMWISRYDSTIQATAIHTAIPISTKTKAVGEKQGSLFGLHPKQFPTCLGLVQSIYYCSHGRFRIR